MQKLQPELSEKFLIFSFFSILGIVLLHSYNISYFTNDNSFTYKISFFLQRFFSDGICRLAVPYFFFTSGFLYFYTVETYIHILAKIKSRVRTVFIPFIFWSAFGLALYFLIQLTPNSSSFFNGKLIQNYSLNEILFRLFIKPLPYQLWFLQYLFLIIICSPLIFFLIKKIGKIFLIILFIIWIKADITPFMVDESILYFCIGAYFAIKKYKITDFNFSSKKIATIGLIWIVILLFKSYYLLINHSVFLEFSVLRISIVFGLLFVWNSYDLIKFPKYLNAYYSLSFFIFAFHEPLLTIIKKALIYFFNSKVEFSLLIYFLAPVLTVMISIISGLLVKNYIYRFYKFINGNR